MSGNRPDPAILCPITWPGKEFHMHELQAPSRGAAAAANVTITNNTSQ
jgi:hypothetical protein